MRKTIILISAATGYVLGARAGRERYEQICTLWGRVRSNPQVQSAAETVAHKGSDMAHTMVDKAADKAPNWMPGSRDGDAESTIGTTGTANAQNGMPSGVPTGNGRF